MLELSPDVLQALVALQKERSVATAGQSLGRSSSSMAYLLGQVRDVVGYEVIDRRAYRSCLNARGEQLAIAALEVLEAYRRLERQAQASKDGWEPTLSIIYDGLIESGALMAALASLMGSPTQVEVHTGHLDEVEGRYREQDLDLMISLTALPQTQELCLDLRPIGSYLVAHRDFPLLDKPSLTLDDLRDFPLITIRGGSPKLGLSTAAIESNSTFRVDHFWAKLTAIRHNLGFGWLPESLLAPHLESGELRIIEGFVQHQHEFHPKLIFSKSAQFGEAVQLFLKHLSDSGFLMS